MAYGVIPMDDNDQPVLALYDDATGKVFPVHIKSKVIGADGKTYAILDTGSGGGGGGADTQYTDGQAPPTNPIGNALVYDNGGTWEDVGLDHPFPVSTASVGADGSTAPTSSTQMGGSDGANLRPLTAAIFHNTDAQVLPATAYGMLTGGIAQIVNASGVVDRQRGTGFDGVPAVGIATGAQQLAGPAMSTTFGVGGVTGSTNAQSVLVVSSATAKVGDIIVTQDNQEYVEITAIADGTHITGVFKNNHAAGQTLTWYHYNQARDATVGDATSLTGMGASATYLYNNVAATLEFDRSANGEKDGASGQGTAIAAGYEFNGGGPILTGGTLSGLAFDRERNLQAKALNTATITSTNIGDTALAYGSAAATKTVQPGAPILLAAGSITVAANQKEVVYVAATWTPGSSASVPLQSPVVNAGSTTAAWEVYAFQGPGLNGFSAIGIGIEEEALFDPVTQLFYIERAATQDNVAPQNVLLAAHGLWNGAGIDRWQGKNGAGYTARNAQAVYSLASTLESASGNSGDLAVGAYTEIGIDLTTTAQAGIGPTIQFFWERKGADGLYYPLWQSVVYTAATNTYSTSIGAGMNYLASLGITGRFRWLLGGSGSPSYTFSVNVYGK